MDPAGTGTYCHLEYPAVCDSKENLAGGYWKFIKKCVNVEYVVFLYV
jgi:hypothetical protein